MDGRKRGRGRGGVKGSVRDAGIVSELDVGKRVIACVGFWQGCKMPGTRMCWRLSQCRYA